MAVKRMIHLKVIEWRDGLCSRRRRKVNVSLNLIKHKEAIKIR